MTGGAGMVREKRVGGPSDERGHLGAALAFGLLVMLLGAVLSVRRSFRSRSKVAASTPGRSDRRDGDVVTAVRAEVPVIDAVVEGSVTGDCPTEELNDDVSEADVVATDAGETVIDTPESVASTRPTASLTAFGFVPAQGKAKAEVLGTPRLSYGGAELSFGRAEAADLFALLATSREGISSQGIIDTLWQGDDERGCRLLESAVRQLNQVMRQASGLTAQVKFVVKARQRRQLAAAYFDVDYWRFDEAFVRAGTAEEEPARLGALQEMLALYQGQLLAGRDDLWILPLRQSAQRQAVDAAERLAELVRTRDPDRALDVLRLAVERIDPHNEVLWCGIMSVHGELGRLPAVRRSYELLRERLAEIDAVPSPQARQVYERLVR